MDTPKDIIKNYHVKPRKKLGQSFLLDQNIIRKIVAAAPLTPQDVVVEIGAGIGVLTEGLAQNARKLIAVELDKNLVAILQDKLAGRGNVEIHSGDIMKFDFNSISNTYNSKIKVFGNVPYNISSPVIFRLLAVRSIISDFTLMLQKEVVQRLVAEPNNKIYGVPSVLLQMFASLEKILDVPATCFYPQPKVESAVVRGTFFKEPATKLLSEAFFTSLVKAAFAQRRKMLINNLKNSSLLADIEEEKIKNALISAGIDGRRRAETLSVPEFGNLSNLLHELAQNK